MSDYCTSLEKTTLVSLIIKIADSASCYSQFQENSVINSKHVQIKPTLERTTSDGLHFIREDLAYKGIERVIVSIFMDSWRKTTGHKYASVLQQWEYFCIERKINPLRGSLADRLHFMSLKKEQGSRYVFFLKLKHSNCKPGAWIE